MHSADDRSRGLEEAYHQAAHLISNADGLLIAAGAGMGVDSGLPDFRGAAGFWTAYPALGAARLQFSDIANLAMFAQDPTLAWGFYGHRLQLYRRTRPHAGFGLLLAIGERLQHGAFVFTSNVDGAFQAAGFPADRIVECHGSIHRLQCSENCTGATWSADTLVPIVDEQTCRLQSSVPTCPDCSAVARPNILMFSDWGWISTDTDEQQARLDQWLQRVHHPLVIEVGAGDAIPTVRYFAESIGGHVIRINPVRDPSPSHLTTEIESTALVGIVGIAEVLELRRPGND